MLCVPGEYVFVAAIQKKGFDGDPHPEHVKHVMEEGIRHCLEERWLRGVGGQLVPLTVSLGKAIIGGMFGVCSESMTVQVSNPVDLLVERRSGFQLLAPGRIRLAWMIAG